MNVSRISEGVCLYECPEAADEPGEGENGDGTHAEQEFDCVALCVGHCRVAGRAAPIYQ